MSYQPITYIFLPSLCDSSTVQLVELLRLQAAGKGGQEVGLGLGLGLTIDDGGSGGGSRGDVRLVELRILTVNRSTVSYNM